MPAQSVNLEAFFEIPNSLLCLAGEDGSMKRVSSAFEPLLGYTPAEFLDTPWIDFVHPEDQLATLEGWDEFIRGTPGSEFENRLRCKDGTYLWFAWNGYRQGNWIYAIAHNITRHHEAERAILDRETHFRSFFEQPLVGMAITSPSKGMLMVNEKLCELLGYRQEELMRLDWTQITHPDDLATDMEQFEQVQAGAIEGYCVDKRFIRSDGEVIDTIMTCRCLRDLQGKVVHFVALVQDITERKQLEMDLRQSLDREKDLGAMKTRFVSMVSHEFRNPLAAILTSSDLLKKYSQRMDEARKAEHLDRIQIQVQHLTGLLEDILTVNRAQAMGVELNSTWVDLEMLCHDIVNETEAFYAGHPIEYTYSCEALFVALDEKLLRQAVTNLLSNAIKYSPQGKKVQLQVTCADNQICLQVCDQGIGIPANDLQRLFEPFYRASNVAGIAGTGLGLAIVRQAVEAHHGTITVASEVGVGTNFTILLPLVEQKR